jgi:streptomycin 6-kinase
VVEIPARFSQHLIDREGDPGRAWIASLPGLVEEFLQRWGCRPTGLVGGNVGIVLAVRRDDGTPAVLKISFTHPGNRYGAHAFATWAGRGAVRLYERDDSRFAMLLERAEWRTLAELGDADQAPAVLGRLARRLAVEAPPALPPLSKRADEWEQTLRENAKRHGHPLSQRAFGAAIAAVQDLGYTQPHTMVHGDLHSGNVVRAEREPWLVIDPKGFVGDLAFDAANVLIGGLDSLRSANDLRSEVLRRLAIFADAAEIDRERAVRWAQVRATMSACRGRSVDDNDGEVQLRVQTAELLA